MPITVLGSIARVQPALHSFFVMGLLVWFLGYSAGVTSVKKILEAKAVIQEAVDGFLVAEGRVPLTIDEVLQRSHKAREAREALGGQPIRIEAIGKLEYRITFAGHDGKFGTPDDWEVTKGTSMRKFLEWEKRGGK